MTKMFCTTSKISDMKQMSQTFRYSKNIKWLEFFFYKNCKCRITKGLLPRRLSTQNKVEYSPNIYLYKNGGRFVQLKFNTLGQKYI